jgi:hypothetical protein
MRFCVFAFLLTLSILGCNSSSQPKVEVAPPGDPNREKVAPPEMIESLDYANWKQFPIGTEVIRKEVTASKDTSVTSIRTWKLVELTPEEMVLEWQVTTERADGSYKSVNPPNRSTVKQSFALPKGMSADEFAKPSLNAKKTGEEEITLLGQKYQATVFEWKNSTEGGDMLVKAWFSNAVPGRILKQEMKVAALGRTTIDELVEIKKPEGK